MQLLQDYSGATNSTEFQAIPRPLQKHYLYLAHEEGIGPRTLSRLTGCYMLSLSKYILHRLLRQAQDRR